MQLDGLAVELEQEGQWNVIHHFIWNGNPGFRGTEAVQINPAYQEMIDMDFHQQINLLAPHRSEERRVGKEC